MSARGGHTLVIMLAASLASTIGGLPFNTLPILLGALADGFALDAPQVGLLGSGCFGGYLLGTLVAASFMERLPWRWLTVGCAMGAAAALLASSVLPAGAQLPLWAVVGFFAALMSCLGLRIMGEMVNKERALGLRLGIELGVTAAVLFALPSLVIATYHYAGAAVVLAGIVAVLSLSAFALPRGSDLRGGACETAGFTLSSAAVLPRRAYAALALFFVFGAGQIGLWAFLERLGQALALKPADLGTVFAVLKLLGGAAAFVLAVLGDRLGLRLPHLLVFIVLSSGLALLHLAEGFGMFAVGAWVWEVGFTWGCIYQTAAIARLDPGGRAIMLIPAAFALSSMVGPAVAGMMVSKGFAPVLWVAFASALVAVLAFGAVLSRRPHREGPKFCELAPAGDVS